MIYTIGRKPISPSGSDSVDLPSRTAFSVAHATSQYTSPSSKAEYSTDSATEKLAARIVQRIESRLPCRIRSLKVSVSQNAVILEGRCSTYYTKQIAQHTAMGALEYERLINNLEVRPGK